MIIRLKEILTGLEEQLERLETEDHDALYRPKRALMYIRDSCREFTVSILNQQLKDKEEEIYFYKELKSRFYSHLYYYTDVFNIESRKPYGGESAQRKHLEEQLLHINEHFIRNSFLYQYHRMDMTSMDDRYFTTIKKLDSRYDASGQLEQSEEEHSSFCDKLYAKILSNTRLEKYINTELSKLDTALQSRDTTVQGKTKRLVWTASKTSLVELIYALHHGKCLNHGKAEIKDIAKIASVFLNIELGDFYRTYNEIKMRNHRTRFLTELIDTFEQRMNEEDEKGSLLSR